MCHQCPQIPCLCSQLWVLDHDLEMMLEAESCEIHCSPKKRVTAKCHFGNLPHPRLIVGPQAAQRCCAARYMEKLPGGRSEQQDSYAPFFRSFAFSLSGCVRVRAYFSRDVSMICLFLCCGIQRRLSTIRDRPTRHDIRRVFSFHFPTVTEIRPFSALCPLP